MKYAVENNITPVTNRKKNAHLNPSGHIQSFAPIIIIQAPTTNKIFDNIRNTLGTFSPSDLLFSTNSPDGGTELSV